MCYIYIKLLQGVDENYIQNYKSKKDDDGSDQLKGTGLNPKQDKLSQELPSIVEVR